MAVTTPTTIPRAETTVATPEAKIGLAFLITALIGLLFGVFLGPIQALNYAGIDLYQYGLPFLQSYYQGLTIHGVMTAIVFTTFFISGMLLYLPARELGVRPNLTLSWIAYGMMVTGLVIAAVAIITNTSTVLYTFYPPLQGHWGFYLGAGLIVLGSLVIGFVVWQMWRRWKALNPGAYTPLLAYMSLLTWLMWGLASLGLVGSVLFLLLPWSFGLVEGVDPLLARSLFWYTGHPIVYFWVMPAYVVWYAFLPRLAGGKLLSDPLGRLVFVLFLLFSIPVGYHHQYADPGIPVAWRLVHNVLTMFIAIPSLITAFTIGASLEYAGRKRGGRGLLGWIPALPWHNASFTATVLAMITFIFGGAGGIVLAGFFNNMAVHNTAFVPGHFHITVGTATTLTFMGLCYWLIPHLSGRRLYSNTIALVSSSLWAFGMLVFAVGMHWQGLLGVPRRSHISNLIPALADAYAHAQVPAAITGASGVFLFTAGILFFFVIGMTLVFGKRLKETEVPQIPFTDFIAGPTDLEGRIKPSVRLFERVGLWFLVAVVLILFAYGPSLVSQIVNAVPIPGMRFW
jgi:cytochrome c oxidase subunit I